MDDSIEQTVNRAPVCRFGPDRRLTAATAVLAVAAAAAALLTHDGPGRVLFAGVAALLIGYAATDLAFWPRLTASAAGLVIRTPLQRATLPWAQVAAVRADSRERFGLRSVTLEVDAGETLVVFSRRALGADPETVAALVGAMDPRR